MSSDEEQYEVGYTQGTYDLFHIGHLNLLENAKKKCKYLIVGINSDELVLMYKNKKVNITDVDRARIVGALKVVDEVHIVDTLDKNLMYSKFKFDAIFIGDDWKGNERWVNTEKQLDKFGVKVEYLPHTEGISTTILSKKISNKREEER